MEDKKGVSLIILVITIIIIIVLASAIILSISDNNPASAAKEAVFKGDLDTFRTELLLYNTQMYASTSGTYNENNLQTGTDTIGDIIKSLKDNKKYEGKMYIENGKLIFICNGTVEDEWADEIGIIVKCIEPQVSISGPEPTVVNSNNDVKYTVTAVSNYAITNIVEENIKVYKVKNDGEEQDTELSDILAFSYVDETSEDEKYLKLIEVTVGTSSLVDGNYYIKVLPDTVITQVSGKETKNKEEVKSSTFELNGTVPTAPYIEISTQYPTNQDITVTITYYSDSVEKKYSLNEGDTWFDYSDVFILSYNTKIIAKGINYLGTSASSSLDVTNIDKIVPILTLSSTQITSTSITVQALATDTGGSEINTSSYQYSKDNGATWSSTTTNTTYKFENLVSGTYECKAKVKDNAGNETIASKTVEVPVPSAPSNWAFLGAIYSTTDWVVPETGWYKIHVIGKGGNGGAGANGVLLGSSDWGRAGRRWRRRSRWRTGNITTIFNGGNGYSYYSLFYASNI